MPDPARPSGSGGACKVNSPWRDLLVNIEVQGDFYPGYPLVNRAQYYCARLLSGQSGVDFAGSRYGDLRGVYSIWICLNPPKRQSGAVSCWPVERDMIDSQGNKLGQWLSHVVTICVDAPGSEGLPGFLGTLFSAEISPEEKIELLASRYNVISKTRRKLWQKGRGQWAFSARCSRSAARKNGGPAAGWKAGQREE